MRLLKRSVRALLFGVAVVAIAVPVSSASAQRSQRGQPKTPFGITDLGKLHWLEGTWEGTSPGERTFYERIHFSSDSTVDIEYYMDPALSRQTGSGRVYLSVGRIFHTFGPARWGASHVDENSIYFVPQVSANNTFAWTFQSPDAWTATMRSGFSGQERVTVYQMKRISGR